MSKFEVKITTVLEVNEHDNSDNLELLTVFGYQVVATIGIYKAGDVVAYIPEGSVVPVDIQQKLTTSELNGEGYLSGPNKDRMKAIKLRGEISQGMLLKTSDLDFDVQLGDDIADKIGITKYVAPIPTEMSGQVSGMKNFKPTNFDFNSIRKDKDFFGNGEQVVITEKLHGTYTNVMVIYEMSDEDGFKRLDEHTQIGVTSKGMGAKGLNINISEENKNNVYVKVALEEFPLEKVDEFEFPRTAWPVSGVEFMGETYGTVQNGFRYDTESGNKFRLFDIRVAYKGPNGEIKKVYMNPNFVSWFCVEHDIEQVPVLYEGPFHMSFFAKHAHGDTTLMDDGHIKEGAVCRPVAERVSHRGNRIIAKFISEQYLIRKGKKGVEPTEHS